jgi:chorismate-pyruvate lyase
MKAACVASLTLLVSIKTQGAGSSSWPDTFVGRVEALAVLQSLNADLLSHDSATLTLERWCGAHLLASPAQIRAERVADVDKPADETIRQQLQVGPDEVVRYRRVRLRCGEIELSDADNWYVPSRLTPDMTLRLDQTDEPFGKVVAPLHFTRHTQSAQLLWSPLPEGWEMRRRRMTSLGRGTLTVPAAVLEHHALLTRADGTPFSALVETYTRNVMEFAAPR